MVVECIVAITEYDGLEASEHTVNQLGSQDDLYHLNVRSRHPGINGRDILNIEYEEHEHADNPN